MVRFIPKHLIIFDAVASGIIFALYISNCYINGIIKYLYFQAFFSAIIVVHTYIVKVEQYVQGGHLASSG